MKKDGKKDRGSPGLLQRIFKRRNNTDDEDGEDEETKTKPRREKIDSFETVTLHTSGMRHIGETEIVMKDGKAEVSQYGLRFHQEGERRVLERRAECSEEEMLKLLNRCRLLSWDGFHGSHPKGVLDGTMFRLNAKVNGGIQIYASGSQNFPPHYRDLTDGLYEILHRQQDGGSDGEE